MNMIKNAICRMVLPVAGKGGYLRTYTSVNLPNGLSVLELHSLITKLLLSHNIDEAALSSRYIIAHATKIGYKKSDFDKSSSTQVLQEVVSTINHMVQRRLQHEPVQYILGNWDFYSLELECQPPVLIPRPETEELVSRILNTTILQKLQKPRILDIGAGTGAIGLALLSQVPDASSIAIDIDEAAVSLANRNARRVQLNQRYTCMHSSLQNYSPTHQFDIIVSNPPYIPSHEMPSLQKEVTFESSVALDGGISGLDVIREIIIAAPKLLSPTGSREVWLEVHESHPACMEDLVTEIGNGVRVISVENDSFGLPRFVRLRVIK